MIVMQYGRDGVILLNRDLRCFFEIAFLIDLIACCAMVCIYRVMFTFAYIQMKQNEIVFFL